MLRIVQADTKEPVNQAAALFREYATALAVDLSFQGFEKELAELPGEYAPPGGLLLLAFVEDLPKVSVASPTRPAGCIALRRMDSTNCEMKRLYVRPEFRGHGLGRTLAEAAIKAAREIGYQRMRLDTLPQMSEAQILYGTLGFKEIPPYRFNPVAGARFLELILSQ
jgi:putative acetyltransferase